MALTREQILDLLDYLGVDNVAERGNKDDIMMCCPIHGESNPSCGISISKQKFHCFSCGKSGSLVWFTFLSKRDDFRNINQVEEFLSERYGADFKQFESEFLSSGIKRYNDFLNDHTESRFELPMSKLAPFKSGKETYSYFFDRGFTKNTAKKFMIGRDLIEETVTIPLYWEDGVLAGIIGRYIDPNVPSEHRYKVYSFPKSELLYPLHKFQVVDGTIIGVEGILDALWMHQNGFLNTLAILGNQMTYQQAKFIRTHCCKFIDMFDNDKGGITAREFARKRLGKSINYYTVPYPSEKKKDPQNCDHNDLKWMLDNKQSILTFKLRNGDG